MSEKEPVVAILMGSDSDLPVMRSTLEVLKQFSIASEMKITSAHRTPEATHAYVKDAEARGCAVFIAAAGLAAHLAGAVSAITTKPVIGVPLDAGPLSGMDALLATVQMPGGIPVGCVAIGKAGALSAKDRDHSPLRAAHIARNPPQPGQFQPVISRMAHRENQASFHVHTRAVPSASVPAGIRKPPV